jgi:hypothetical protein
MFQAVQKALEARRVRVDERRTSVVRWSESGKRNEAGEAFSTA